MENEELVYSFMEISNLPIEEAKTYLEQSDYDINLALQNYLNSQQKTTTTPSTSQSSSTTTQQTSTSSENSLQNEDEIRQPIPRQFDQMIQDEDIRNVRLSRISVVRSQFSSQFRDFRKEIEIQEDLATNGSAANAAKRKCLEDLYRHPVYITNVDFNYAKLQGQKYGKWVAILINDESLESLSFNRDIFNESSQKAKQLITQNFIFIRKNCNDHEGIRIRQIYNLNTSTIPIFLIIDSLTGELKKNFGDCSKLTLKSVVKELKKYTCSSDKQLVYNSSYEDSDEEDSTNGFSHLLNIPPPSTSGSSNSTSQNKPSASVNKKYVESDEESFASLNSNDISDDEFKEKSEEGSDQEEAKVLDSDDELLKNDDGPQTNVMLRLEEEQHKFKYPSTRTVANLINYIYRNYLIQTGIYDNKTKRFSLFSKIHNKCLTMLDQEKSLQEADIHPSIVLLHRVCDKDD
ncbi:hypothetical protein PVAND_000450 [Polypedilum vanderplanki]|uniref:UBX domain-containing protein n=1 Tax=Polypedilum vanderplanki TaxID=319348 RepID=A0A9J6BJV2_POLVA|nr:hypothetical protein PVAND_000450 [Polypedilum vanderplanki]